MKTQDMTKDMHIIVAKDREDVPNFATMRDTIIGQFKRLINRDALRKCAYAERFSIIGERFPFKYGHGANKVAILNMEGIENYVVKFNQSAKDYFSIVREAMIYDEARREGIGEYFAKTYYIGTVDFMAITIQEKVFVDEDYNSDATYRKLSARHTEEELMDEYEYEMEGVEDYQRESFEDWKISYFDSEECEMDGGEYAKEFLGKNLRWFFDQFRITDIHVGNFGFKVEGDDSTFCFIDFSGYDDWEEALNSSIYDFEDFVQEEWADEVKRIYFGENQRRIIYERIRQGDV